MSVSITEACAYVSDALSAAANPEKAVGMQAYMKTDMPFYGCRSRGGHRSFADCSGSSPRRIAISTRASFWPYGRFHIVRRSIWLRVSRSVISNTWSPSPFHSFAG